jgi:3-oxoacyl-[acyl-carrier protein] reductase
VTAASSPADVAVVTGASGGIGSAIARAIRRQSKTSEDGLALGLHCHSDRAGAERLSEELGDCFVVEADLSTSAGRARLLDEALAHGTPYILVNSAGADRPHETALDVSEDAFDALVALNLKAPLFLMRAFAREMARAGSGVIVNVTSVLARRAVTGSAVYRATKAALEALTKQYAMELGPRRIRVNAVAPGFIETPMTAELPEERREQARREIACGEMGRPEAVAEAVCHLIENDYANGVVIPIDGGMGL